MSFSVGCNKIVIYADVLPPLKCITLVIVKYFLIDRPQTLKHLSQHLFCSIAVTRKFFSFYKYSQAIPFLL